MTNAKSMGLAKNFVIQKSIVGLSFLTANGH